MNIEVVKRIGKYRIVKLEGKYHLATRKRLRWDGRGRKVKRDSVKFNFVFEIERKELDAFMKDFNKKSADALSLILKCK